MAIRSCLTDFPVIVIFVFGQGVPTCRGVKLPAAEMPAAAPLRSSTGPPIKLRPADRNEETEMIAMKHELSHSILDRKLIDDLKGIMRESWPEKRPTALVEALARGLQYKSFASLLHDADKESVRAQLDEALFDAYLEKPSAKKREV
jgi:hypothetical protein